VGIVTTARTRQAGHWIVLWVARSVMAGNLASLGRVQNEAPTAGKQERRGAG
jgi:hypothetical protein